MELQLSAHLLTEQSSNRAMYILLSSAHPCYDRSQSPLAEASELQFGLAAGSGKVDLTSGKSVDVACGCFR